MKFRRAAIRMTPSIRVHFLYYDVLIEVRLRIVRLDLRLLDPLQPFEND